jgi:hypothetical protein
MSAVHSTAAIYHCTRGNRTQILLCADLEHPGTLPLLQSLLPPVVRLVYSDPPWNPGNATYWRTHAGREPCANYNRFLDSWCAVVAECIARGGTDIFAEQSTNDRHCAMFMAAVARQPRWSLPLLEQWTVYYGSPGSASVRRPNVLLHFGNTRLSTDPTGMAGEPMTIRTCAGVRATPGACVVDPCMGKGMTSRMAHYFDWDCLGVEINPKRLGVTLEWLKRQGYGVQKHGA